MINLVFDYTRVVGDFDDAIVALTQININRKTRAVDAPHLFPK